MLWFYVIMKWCKNDIHVMWDVNVVFILFMFPRNFLWTEVPRARWWFRWRWKWNEWLWYKDGWIWLFPEDFTSRRFTCYLYYWDTDVANVDQTSAFSDAMYSVTSQTEYTMFPCDFLIFHMATLTILEMIVWTSYILIYRIKARDLA